MYLSYNLILQISRLNNQTLLHRTCELFCPRVSRALFVKPATANPTVLSWSLFSFGSIQSTGLECPFKVT